MEILVPLYDLIQNQVPGITQAAKILNSYPIYAGTIFYTESRLWRGSIYRRLAGRRQVRNRFYAEITRDIPYWIFSILLRIIKGIDGFCEPFVSFGRNKKAEVVLYYPTTSQAAFFHTFRDERGRGGVLFQTNLDWEKVWQQSFSPRL